MPLALRRPGPTEDGNMTTIVEKTKKYYLAEIRLLDHVKHVFLLIVRLYFGWGFISAGLGKLLNVETHTGFFRDWDIPLPMLNVYLAGTTETVCGFLLLIGLASRIITIPLIGTMIVAYLTAHTEQFYALWDNTPLFFKAPPFPYLFTCLVVLLFGPGRLSIDGMVKAHLECEHHGLRKPETSTAAAGLFVSPPAPIDPDTITVPSRAQP
jgi:putative oxidoreductase